MRIAYVSADRGVPVFGVKGNSVHVQELIRAFQRLGHSIELFAARVGGAVPEGLAGVTVHELPLFAVGRPADLAAANADTARLIRAVGPFDLVYERYSLWSHAGVTAARPDGRPVIVEVNAPLIEEDRRYRNGRDHQGAAEVARVALGQATAIVAVSQGVADYVRTIVEANVPVAVVPNGVDPRRFRSLRQVSERPTFTIGFVGTMKPWHGLSVLADAFGRLARQQPHARLLLVGDGPERARVQAILAREGLASRVEWTGPVNPAAIPGLLARMDVAVAPYPDATGCYFSPLKVFEYLAAGLPVVASRVGQLAELLLHDRSALLVAPGDPGELAQAIERLAGDRALRHRIAGAGRILVESEYTWERAATRILGLTRPRLPRRRILAGVAY